MLIPRACKTAMHAAYECAGMECMKCLAGAFQEAQKDTVGLPLCKDLAETPVCEVFAACVCPSDCDILETEAAAACATKQIKAEKEACSNLCGVEPPIPDKFLCSSEGMRERDHFECDINVY